MSYEHGQLFQHTDGGYYRYLDQARHADDQAVHVRYEHLWPFETGMPWVRRIHEWEARFKPVSEEQLREAMKQDRAEAQKAVAEAKASRRAAQKA